MKKTVFILLLLITSLSGFSETIQDRQGDSHYDDAIIVQTLHQERCTLDICIL